MCRKKSEAASARLGGGIIGKSAGKDTPPDAIDGVTADRHGVGCFHHSHSVDVAVGKEKLFISLLCRLGGLQIFTDIMLKTVLGLADRSFQPLSKSQAFITVHVRFTEGRAFA